MSARVRSRSRGRGDGQETSGPIKPVIALKSSDKKSEEKPLPTKSQDIETGLEEEEGIIVVEIEEEPELDVDCLETSMKSTVCEGKDGSDVKEDSI